jgi:hypothetical protein
MSPAGQGTQHVRFWLLQLRKFEHAYELEGWQLEVTATRYRLVGM